jgi:hypothetical protein
VRALHASSNAARRFLHVIGDDESVEAFNRRAESGLEIGEDLLRQI